jgi:hypothetical protein
MQHADLTGFSRTGASWHHRVRASCRAPRGAVAARGLTAPNTPLVRPSNYFAILEIIILAMVKTWKAATIRFVLLLRDFAIQAFLITKPGNHQMVP